MADIKFLQDIDFTGVTSKNFVVESENAPGSGAVAGSAGTANTGGGGGGGSFFGTPYATGSGGNGGSGTVIIRYKYQN